MPSAEAGVHDGSGSGGPALGTPLVPLSGERSCSESFLLSCEVLVYSPATAVRFDRRDFREVLGRFCTGVTIISAIDEKRPVGFSCQSFSSLSLDPPLVSFAVADTSTTGPRIERAGTFCASVLGGDQTELCRRFGTSGADKFAGVEWSPAVVTGSPQIGGSLAWVDCRVESVVPAGDHRIVVGRVVDLSVSDGVEDAGPLLFYRGGFLRCRTTLDGAR